MADFVGVNQVSILNYCVSEQHLVKYGDGYSAISEKLFNPSLGLLSSLKQTDRMCVK